MGWSWVYSACVARQKFSMLGDGQVRAYPGIIWDLLPGCLSSCPFPPSSYIRSFSDWFKVFTIIVTEEEAVSSVFTACEIHESGPTKRPRIRDNSKHLKTGVCDGLATIQKTKNPRFVQNVSKNVVFVGPESSWRLEGMVKPQPEMQRIWAIWQRILLVKKGYDLGFTSSNRHHHSVTVVEMKPDKSSLPTCLRLNGNFSMQGRLNSTSLSSPQFWQVLIFLLHMVERCHKLDPKVRSQYESELLWHRIWGPCLLQFPASSSASFASSRALPACTCLMRWHPNSCHHETKEEIISDCCTSHERFLRKIGAKIDDGISWEASEVGLRVLKIRRKFQRRESSFCF